MTTPSIVSANYAANSSAYRTCKEDRSGASRTEYFSVSVPSGTTTTTIIGLVPFQAGAKFSYDSTLYTDNLGASVTATLGYVYEDNVKYADAPAAFGSALALSAAGFLIPNVRTGMAFKAGFVPAPADGVLTNLANGWIVLVISGATTGTTGTIDGQITLFYDQA